MKKSQLKAIIKEVVSQVVQEINPAMSDADYYKYMKPREYEVIDQDTVHFNNIETANGDLVTVVLNMTGGETGASGFDYERGMERGVHNIPSQKTVEDYKIVGVYSQISGREVTMPGGIRQTVADLMKQRQDDIEQELNARFSP